MESSIFSWLNPNAPLWTQLQPAVFSLAIFTLRSIDVAIATIMTLSMVQGKRLITWLSGFTRSLLFVASMVGVIANLHNPWNIFSFAAGYAAGTGLGMVLNTRIGARNSLLRITSSRRSGAVAQALHLQGRGATEVPGRGREGTVGVIYCYVPRRAVPQAVRTVLEADPQAFITVEKVRQVYGGWGT